MSRETPDPFRLPRTGREAVPSIGLASAYLNGNGGMFTSGEFVAESTFPGVMVYAIYQALVTAFRTEAVGRRGDIDRATQVRSIATTVWESSKQGAWVSILSSVFLVVFPWLSWPLVVLGAVGMGKASMDLFHAFWDGLAHTHRFEFLSAVFDAGVNLRCFLGGDERGDVSCIA